MLRALAFHLLRSPEAMDDALQDAYLKAHRGLVGFRGEASVRTWLYGITYRTCLDHLRAGERRRADVLDDRTADRVDHIGATDDRLRLQAALDRLPPEQRAVVLAVDLAGFSYEEVAAVLGVAPGTVGSRLNRARGALRAELRHRSDDNDRDDNARDDSAPDDKDQHERP
jgi:RNA polymerase sigma-70 factor (ECF subfamily)